MRRDLEAAARPLISVTEAAALAGISKSVAYRLAAADALPGMVRLPGARLLVRWRVLEAWLNGNDGDESQSVSADGDVGSQRLSVSTNQRRIAG